MNPTVTIVIPCYNAEKWLRETIECCINQTYPAIELIIVDDGSTDASLSIIQSYGDKVHYMTGVNRSGCYARNQGLKVATGEYIMFLDADDFIDTDTIAGLVTALESRVEFVAACPWSILQQDGAAQQIIPQSYNEHLDPIWGWLTGHYIPPCALLWSRSLVFELGGWDETLTANQDGDLMLRAFLNGAGITLATTGHAYYRHIKGHLSVSNTVSTKSIQSRMRVLEKVEEHLVAQNRLDTYKIALGQAYHGLAIMAFPVDIQLSRMSNTHSMRLAGQAGIRGTLLHQLLCRLIGLEAKEQLAHWLHKMGLRHVYQQMIRAKRI